MTVNEASLFVLAAVILIVVWYIDKHSETKPRYKRGPRSR